jgi:hypothetical protein
MVTITKILKDVTIYPNTPGYLVEVLADDNSRYEATKPKAEVDLELYIKLLKNKLTSKEIDKLKSLISDFGDLRYEEGDFNATYEG